MRTLDDVIAAAVTAYRIVFISCSITTIGYLLLTSQFVMLMLVLPILLITYFGGLHVVAFLLGFFSGLLPAPSQSERIRIINERLASGELQPDTQELEDEMISAGLRPMSMIVGYGPVFGRQFDADLYEYVEAREGLNGEVHQYKYVGPARYDSDGTIDVEVQGDELYVVLNDSLYRYDPEPENTKTETKSS